MRTFPVFAILFFIVPFFEIWLLIKVGGQIGALPTMLLVVLTAVLGAFLLRQQGLSTLARFQQNLNSGQLPAKEIVEGMVLLVGGALLMTPGFFTDALGFICLFPLTRSLMLKYLVQRTQVYMQSRTVNFSQDGFQQTHSRAQQNNNDIEGEVVRRHDDEPLPK